VKKTLAALALAAAAVATLAGPAGASTRTTRTHQTLRCQGGRHATITYKWQGPVAVDSWVDNRCRHQWLTVIYCENPDGQSPKCGATDITPGTKTHLGPLNYSDRAMLVDQPTCGAPDNNGCEY